MRPVPIFLACALLVPLAAPAAADVGYDWVSVRAIMPSAVDEYDLYATLWVEAPPEGVIIGRAFEQSGDDWRFVDVESDDHDVDSVTVGAVVASQTVALDKRDVALVGTGLSVRGHVAAGEEVRFIVFVPGSRIVDSYLDIRSGGQTLSGAPLYGSGSGGVRIVDGAGVGVTQATGPTAGSGVVLVEREVEEPIVGSLAGPSCVGCVSAWHSPDGREGRWVDAVLVGGGALDFEGPAGTWTFAQVGGGTSHAVAGWVPARAFE